jgi:hypothetical protein
VRSAGALAAVLGVAAWIAAPEALQAEPEAGREARARLELSIDTPEPGAVIGDPAGTVFLAGRAIALYGEYQTFDIILVIDTSESTSGPSGADIDGDGEIGQPRGGPWLSGLGRILPFPLTDDDDTVLAAEIAAAEALLEQLDARTTRVGVVVFSGDMDPMTPDAYTEVPLTTDHAKVRRGLARVRERGPAGMTNMVSGINTAIIELLGTESAFSERREGARRIILFLTDGFPTLPYEQSRRLNARAAIERAKRAKRANIRIDTFAIGEDALDEPISVVEMARVTGGIFTPVRSPRDLRAVFEEVSFAEIEHLEVRNRTTGSPAAYRVQNADGSFSALVPMREGTNTLEVFARATDGSEARRTLELRFLADASIQALSPRLISQRNRLLENQLMDLQRRRLAIEEERNEQLRRELRVEIERERQEATERAKEAEKRLQIDVED